MEEINQQANPENQDNKNIERNQRKNLGLNEM